MKFLVQTAARWMLRFNVAMSFMVVINFSFVVVAASPRIEEWTGLRTRWVVLLAVPLAVGMVLFWGWLLDRVGFLRAYQDEQNRRNEAVEMLSKLDELEQQIKLLAEAQANSFENRTITAIEAGIRSGIGKT